MTGQHSMPIVAAASAAVLLTAVDALFVARLGLGDLFVLISGTIGTNLAVLWFAVSALSLLATSMIALMFVLQGIVHGIDRITRVKATARR